MKKRFALLALTGLALLAACQQQPSSSDGAPARVQQEVKEADKPASLLYWERVQELKTSGKTELSNKDFLYYFGLDLLDFEHWLENYQGPASGPMFEEVRNLYGGMISELRSGLSEALESKNSDYDQLGEVPSLRLLFSSVRYGYENFDKEAAALYKTDRENANAVLLGFDDALDDAYLDWQLEQDEALDQELLGLLTPEERDVYESTVDEDHGTFSHLFGVYNTDGDYVAVMNKYWSTTSGMEGNFVVLVNKTKSGFEVLDTAYYENPPREDETASEE